MLYQDLWPRILTEIPLPQELNEILSKSLESTETRTGSFEELLLMLRSNEEKVVAGLINDTDFSIDVSVLTGTILPSMRLDLPETDSLAPKNSSGLEHWGTDDGEKK
jgi:hypothetical protein